MRIANLRDRLVLITPEGAVDVHTASGGRFGPDPRSALDDWAAFHEWALSAEGDAVAYDDGELGAPVPEPRQVFAIGLNYVKHAEESGMPLPGKPMVFTKFPSSITGPRGSITLTGDTVDWEVELVVVIGERAHRVAEGDAWSYVAGLTAGQDISDRTVQQTGTPAAVQHGQVVPGIRPDRAVAGNTG